jgi:hypothetical protein
LLTPRRWRKGALSAAGAYPDASYPDAFPDALV